jgi:ABC-type transporter Mla MlaB component
MGKGGLPLAARKTSPSVRPAPPARLEPTTVHVDCAALTEPDIGTVDAVARIQLTARRLGCRVRLDRASPELRDLLALAGLRDVVPCDAGSGFEAGRQAEGREEPGGIEEEGDPADPVA